jgi:hypothetical protein
MSRHIGDDDLLALIDGESSTPRAVEIEAHLECCAACAARCRELQRVSNDVVRLSRPSDRLPTDVAEARWCISEMMKEDVERRWSWRASMVLAATAALMFFIARHESTLLHRSLIIERGALPIASLTPGLAQHVSSDELCGGRPRTIPEIPADLRIQVLRDYGMEQVPPTDYELDYLITPELGGLPDRRNLWPEPYGLRSWNAHAKDVLENKLPRLVCRGEIDLRTAQREIASNWIAAYKKYLAKEPTIELHARLLELPHRP